MKKLFCTILATVMLLSCGVITTSASTPPAGKIGDADLNKTVNIFDASLIQRFLVGLEQYNDTQFVLGDVDQDRKLTIFDVSAIQRYVAQCPTNPHIGLWYNYDMYEDDFYADYVSGMAMAGVPVTFTANVRAGSPMQRYELYVNNELVTSSETDNSLTHVFEEPGTYSVDMKAVAFFKTGKFHIDYVVVEPYESEVPMFKTIYSTGKYWGCYIYDHPDTAIHAEAIGGQGPYRYKFILTRPEGIWHQAGTITQIQDYSENNIFKLDEINYHDFVGKDHYGSVPTCCCQITVYIKDANGNVVSENITIFYGEHPIG